MHVNSKYCYSFVFFPIYQAIFTLGFLSSRKALPARESSGDSDLHASAQRQLALRRALPLALPALPALPGLQGAEALPADLETKSLVKLRCCHRKLPTFHG